MLRSFSVPEVLCLWSRKKSELYKLWVRSCRHNCQYIITRRYVMRHLIFWMLDDFLVCFTALCLCQGQLCVVFSVSLQVHGRWIQSVQLSGQSPKYSWGAVSFRFLPVERGCISSRPICIQEAKFYWRLQKHETVLTVIRFDLQFT